MSATPHKRPADAATHTIANRLSALCERLERGGVKNLSASEAEHIPTLLRAAQDALATARSDDPEGPLAQYLEAQILRTCFALRKTRHPSMRAYLQHWRDRVPRMLWSGSGIWLFAIVLILCGGVLGFRIAHDIPAAATAFVPDVLADLLGSLAQPMMAQQWTQSFFPNFVGIVLGPDGKLLTLFAGLAAASWLCVYIGSLLTPLLLIAFGAAIGAILGVTPPEGIWPVIVRLSPLVWLTAASMGMSFVAGIRVIQAFLPANDGNKHARRARYLQETLVWLHLAILHMMVGSALFILVIAFESYAAFGLWFDIAWVAIAVIYVLGLGTRHLWRPPISTPFAPQRLDALPYQRPPAPILKRKMLLQLQEGGVVHAHLARRSERFAAFMVDLLIIATAISLISLLVIRGFQSQPKTALVLLGIGLTAVLFGYFFIFEWLCRGQTPGKMLFELRTVRLDGTPMSIWTVWMRNSTYVLANAAPGLLALLTYVAAANLFPLFMTIAFIGTWFAIVFPMLNPRRQRLADYITGTITIERPDRRTRFLPPSSSSDVATSTSAALDHGQRAIIGALITQAQRGQWEGARAAASSLRQTDTEEQPPLSDREVLRLLEDAWSTKSAASSHRR